ncbi:MAG: hypothetical protein ACRDPV_04615 [Gaiellaceae bacterium]
MSVSAWEAVFMLVVLKIPLVYVGAVVLWAIRAEPRMAGGGGEAGVLVPLTPCGWDDWRRRRSTMRLRSRPNRPSGRLARPARVRAA